MESICERYHTTAERPAPYQACWIRPLRPPKVQARFTPPVVIASAADVDDADIDDVWRQWPSATAYDICSEVLPRKQNAE